MIPQVYAPTPPARRRRFNFRPARIVIYTILIGMTIFYLLPVYVGLMAGTKSVEEVSRTSMWTVPQHPTLSGFGNAWSGDKAQGITGLSGGFLNSLFLAIPATIFSALLGSINGYILSKWKFRGVNIIFPLLLFG